MNVEMILLPLGRGGSQTGMSWSSVRKCNNITSLLVISLKMVTGTDTAAKRPQFSRQTRHPSFICKRNSMPGHVLWSCVCAFALHIKCCSAWTFNKAGLNYCFGLWRMSVTVYVNRPFLCVCKQWTRALSVVSTVDSRVCICSHCWWPGTPWLLHSFYSAGEAA